MPTELQTIKSVNAEVDSVSVTGTAAEVVAGRQLRQGLLIVVDPTAADPVFFGIDNTVTTTDNGIPVLPGGSLHFHGEGQYQGAIWAISDSNTTIFYWENYRNNP